MTLSSVTLTDAEFRARYGPWAVVAGASDGTGEAFARQIAAKGVNVVLVARRKQVLEALGEELERAHGIETRVLTIDLSQDEAAGRMFESVADLDVGLYVSNAGGDTTGKHFVDAPLDVCLALVNRNCRTMMEALHRFGGKMKQRGRGGLLVMSSMGGLCGGPRIALYSATKAFDLVLAEGIWVELKPFGVDVLGVAAPGMDTPTFRSVMARKNITKMMPGVYAADDVVRSVLARLPTGHIYLFTAGEEGVSPEEIAASRRARVEASVPMMEFMFGDA
jgi:uncharacterized protein